MTFHWGGNLRATLFVVMILFETFLFNALPSTPLKAQTPPAPVSKSFDVTPLSELDHLVISVSHSELLKQDKAQNYPEKNMQQVAVSIPTSATPGGPPSHDSLADTYSEADVRGTWEKLDADHFIWRLRVSSPDAIFLSFGFTQFYMPHESQLYIYSPDYSWVAGPYTSSDNKESGQLWTPMISGDEAVIEVVVTESGLDALRLELSRVNHGYKGFEAFSQDKSGSCNVDVICSEGNGWRDQIRSVGLYSFTKDYGSFVCTGALVNNTAKDFTPYFLTANHCISTNVIANTAVFYWNYESDICRAPGSSASGTPLPRPSSAQTGSTLQATSASSDFALLLLDSTPASSHNVFYAGWDRSGANPSSAVGIHHPSGHAKRISHDNSPLTTTLYLNDIVSAGGTHFRVANWDSGATEGGSSGSPLFDPSKRIVGQLHGGYAACGNDDSDWYGRLYISWSGGGTSASRLRDWLDPGNTGVTILDGADPQSSSSTTSTPIYFLLD